MWRAWHRLHQDRPSTVLIVGAAKPLGAMVIRSVERPRPIPLAAVEAWADRHGLDPEAATFLERLLLEMDAVYFAWWRARQEVAG